MKWIPPCSLITFLCCILIFSLSACKKTGSALESDRAKNLVLIYMEANNNLEQEALDCINSMEQGALDINGILLVYVKTSSSHSYLLRIKHDMDEYRIMSDTIKTFSTSDYSNPKFLANVIKIAQNEYPSGSFGLVLWSHATSWAPPSISLPKTEAFGYDRGREMDIFELRDALPNNLNFLIFDACNMSSLEVLFEFKDKAKYIIASPSETMAESFPYRDITPFLFNGLEGLKKVAEGYISHYSSFIGLKQSATVTLIKTDELNALANEMKLLIEQEKKSGDIFSAIGVQRLDFTNDFPVPSYDFGDFINKNFIPEKTDKLALQLNKSIIYKAKTPYFLNKPIAGFSGLTCYIPTTNGLYLEYYKKFTWYRSSGFNILAP